MKTTLQAAVDHYGPNNQLAKLAEEASELAAAILQLLHPGPDRDRAQAVRNVQEELDDVEICLQQARIILRHQRPFRAQKLKRLAERLPESSVYPGLTVLMADEEPGVVQETLGSWVLVNGEWYNLDPEADDCYPLRPYEEKDERA